MSSSSVKCPECPYDKLRNLGTHLFFVHGYSKQRITAWRMSVKTDTLSRVRDADGNCPMFHCGFCPKTYRRQNSCRAHERVVHCVTSSMRQKRVPCPIRNCNFVTTALLDLCAHAKESHSELGDFSIKEARFQNMGLFQAWRIQYEESTQSVLATESVNNNAAGGTTLRYLRCAQLEAQIRRVRKMRQHVEETSGDELDEEEENGRETEPPAIPSRIAGRLVQKRKMDDRYGGMSEEVEKEHGVGSVTKKEKEEKEDKRDERDQEDEDEEEEIDVEQLDDNEEILPASSSFVPIPQPIKNNKKEWPEIPRLMRASSAHLAQDEYDANENDRSVRPSFEEEMEKRLSSRHCTAHMRVLVLRSGAVHVEYCNSHLGHDILPLPLNRSPDERLARRKRILPIPTINKDAEEAIEKAKQRRKGRREIEHRWANESRTKTEKDQFDKLCNRYDDIGANVEVDEELYEMADGEVYEEEELPVEEVIEEDAVRLREGPGTSGRR